MREFTDNQYLNRYRKDIKSQFGEDGIIEQIFKIIPKTDQDHFSCEFGAWDGLHCSNTYNLIVNEGWHGVLIEANKKKFKDLQKTYASIGKTTLMNRFVNISGEDTLDDILSETDAPQNFDLLSIDIDSTDYHIWESLERYKPKLVVIEFNPCIPDNIEYIQEANPMKNHGTSLLAMVNLGKRKGYELICVNAENAFFVDQKYFHLFKIEDNSIAALKYYREPLQVFQLFDGTLVFQGEPHHSLVWYSLPVDFNKLQILPKFVRSARLPWGGNFVLRAIMKLLRMYRQRFWKGLDADPGAWKM